MVKKFQTTIIIILPGKICAIIILWYTINRQLVVELHESLHACMNSNKSHPTWA